MPSSQKKGWVIVSRKAKQAVVWFRFKFADDVKTRAAVMMAADRLFRKISGVSERRTYTEEEVVRMVKAALEKAALMPRGQQAEPALGKSAGRTVRPTGKARRFTSAELMEARDRRANITITQTNTDKLPRVRIEWPTGEVSEGVLKQNRKESAE